MGPSCGRIKSKGAAPGGDRYSLDVGLQLRMVCKRSLAHGGLPVRHACLLGSLPAESHVFTACLGL